MTMATDINVGTESERGMSSPGKILYYLSWWIFKSLAGNNVNLMVLLEV